MKKAREQALTLMQSGMSNADVANAVGARIDTVKRWRREAGMQNLNTGKLYGVETDFPAPVSWMAYEDHRSGLTEQQIAEKYGIAEETAITYIDEERRLHKRWLALCRRLRGQKPHPKIAIWQESVREPPKQKENPKPGIGYDNGFWTVDGKPFCSADTHSAVEAIRLYARRKGDVDNDTVRN